MSDGIIISTSCCTEKIIQNLDTVVFTDEYEILGKIDDVFGKVSDPHYLVEIDDYLRN